jgi:hypothetical protein
MRANARPPPGAHIALVEGPGVSTRSLVSSEAPHAPWQGVIGTN